MARTSAASPPRNGHRSLRASSRIRSPAAAATSRWKRTWPSPRPANEGLDLLQKVISGVPNQFGRFGVELGPESRLGMPVARIGIVVPYPLILKLLDTVGSAITSELLAAGRPEDTPAALISDGTGPGQRTLVATLGTLAFEVERSGLRAPAVVVVGGVVELAGLLGAAGLEGAAARLTTQ